MSGWSIGASSHLHVTHLRQFMRSLRHRGPDDAGIFIDERRGIGLAHNRLSIIDLSHLGHQPMVDEETGDVLIFNGEIYNYRELRKALQTSGHMFRSESDSEVLLRAYIEWGTDCTLRIRGMFAFAVWSPRRQSLLLVRDPMGIKPLYYWQMGQGRGIAFASEIKAFLQLPGFRRIVNRRSLHQFLEFGYSCGEETIFQDVQKLLPGTWMRIERGRVVETQTYFQAPKPTVAAASDRQGLADELHDTLDFVVRQHLVADVPVGLLLSGGLDSGLIAALAARHQQIRTFTMGFAESGVDERPYGRIVSKHIGSVHHELEIRPEEISEGLEENVRYFDDVFADWGMISTRLLYGKCKELGIKVVIVGEGSDELFGGYGVFRNALSGGLRGPKHWRLFQLYRQYAGRRYGRCFVEFVRLMGGYLERADDDWFSAIRMFETLNQLPNNYVMKVDKASMAVSVEARVPYLDSRVAELAYRVPRDLLVGPEGGKLLLKHVARNYGLLPDEIIKRPKFGAPLAVSWMDESESFRSYARDIILSPSGWTDELGLGNAMIDYFDRGRRGYAFPHAISVFRNLAWRLLLLNLWSRWYLEPAHAR